MVTKKEVALAAHVSAATVSNVFNKSKKVSPEIRKHVLKVANEIGYISTTSREIILIVNDLNNPHYYQIFEGMNETASRFGFFVTMMFMKESPIDTCRSLIKHKVFAVFFAIPMDNSTACTCKKMLEQVGISTSFSWEDFTMDFEVPTYKAMQHLVTLGHKNIAYLNALSLHDTQNTRYQAYLHALEKLDLKPNPTLITEGIYPYVANVETGYLFMNRLLSSSTKFTAVMTSNDLMAIGAIRAIREHGLNIPDDMSIISCDDILLSQYTAPPLTTLHIAANSLGQHAIYNFFQNIENEATVKPQIDINLIIRDSTGPANI